VHSAAEMEDVCADRWRQKVDVGAFGHGRSRAADRAEEPGAGRREGELRDAER
jgi:hypothetical protein